MALATAHEETSTPLLSRIDRMTRTASGACLRMTPATKVACPTGAGCGAAPE